MEWIASNLAVDHDHPSILSLLFIAGSDEPLMAGLQFLGEHLDMY